MVKNESKKEWWYIVFILVMIIFNLITYFPLFYIYGRALSVQLTVMVIGTIVMSIFIILRIYDKPKVDNSEVAKLYFSATSNLLFAIYAIFGLGFSILWDTLYTSALKQSGSGIYVSYLKLQGLTLVVYLIIAGAIVAYTFLIPLTKKIKENK